MVWGWEWSPEKVIKKQIWQRDNLNGQIYWILANSAGGYSSYPFLFGEKEEGEEWKIRKNMVKVNLL